MGNTLTVAILVGTAREGRETIKAAKLIEEIGKTYNDLEVILVDPMELSFPHDGDSPADRDPRYSEITAKADAFFIVAPEYNHGYPASLKRMLDSEYDNYARKAVSIAGVSSGSWGGVRVVEALTLVVRTMGLVVTRSNVYFPSVQDMFNETGSIKPELADRVTANIKQEFDELIWLARALKAGRSS